MRSLLIATNGKTKARRNYSGRRVLLKEIRRKILDAIALAEYLHDNHTEGFTEHEYDLIGEMVDDAQQLFGAVLMLQNKIRPTKEQLAMEEWRKRNPEKVKQIQKKVEEEMNKREN